MVDQLCAFASEVTRVALEVGTQGILGGQAKVEGNQLKALASEVSRVSLEVDVEGITWTDEIDGQDRHR